MLLGEDCAALIKRSLTSLCSSLVINDDMKGFSGMLATSGTKDEYLDRIWLLQLSLMVILLGICF